MGSLNFTKMHGLGNDFVVIDDLLSSGTADSHLLPRDAVRICDRRLGIGADQILWLKKPHDSSCDARMEILNADGTEAEMCGNGIRAVALYLRKYSSIEKIKYNIETLAGIKQVEFVGHEVRVNMGVPQFLGAELRLECIQVQGRQFEFYDVSMGNPHAVIFVEDVESFPVESYGPFIEKHSRFSKRTNVEFVQVNATHSIQVRVWERGAGITLACGTGACAAAVATLATQRAQGFLDVVLPGGKLVISWAGQGHSVFMQGPAVEVFRGSYDLLGVTS